MSCEEGKPLCGWSLLLLAAGWFLVALFVGETELLSMLPGPAPQITLVSLTVGVLVAYWSSRTFRLQVDELDIRVLVLLHVTRFVGIYFLILHARGELPGQFAVAAGWGDIVVAVGALAVLLIPGAYKSRWAVLGWNTLGLADILFVVFTAAGIAFRDPSAMGALTRLPLSFLPTLLVPLIISSHIVIFLRLIRKPASAQNESPHQALFSI